MWCANLMGKKGLSKNAKGWTCQDGLSSNTKNFILLDSKYDKSIVNCKQRSCFLFTIICPKIYHTFGKIYFLLFLTHLLKLIKNTLLTYFSVYFSSIFPFFVSYQLSNQTFCIHTKYAFVVCVTYMYRITSRQILIGFLLFFFKKKSS